MKHFDIHPPHYTTLFKVSLALRISCQLPLIAHDLSSLYFNKICKLIGMRWLELVLQYMVIVPCTLESKHRTIYTEYEYRVHNEGKHPNDLPDHFTWLLRNLYEVKKQQLELDMEQWACSKLGKEYIRAVYCHPAYLTYMQNTTCKVLDWMKH